MTRRSRPNSSVLRIALLTINALGLVVATGFSAGAVARPGLLQAGAVERPLPQLLASASAVRTSAITLPLLVTLALGRRPSPALLTAAGLVQLGDSGIGLWQRNRGMSLGPAGMGLLHLLTARMLAAASSSSRR